MALPSMFVNYKAYAEGLGQQALKLSSVLAEVAQETGVSVGVVPQLPDLRIIGKTVGIPVYVQHVDECEAGARTGHVTIEAIKDAGAAGSLLNHSEKPMRLSGIEWAVKRMSQLRLQSIVCANTPEVAAAAALLAPSAVAIEPPELIGSGRAVSKAKPEIVRGTVSLIKAVNAKVAILCGAGIVTGDDAKAALRLGADGILVASGIVKARDPRAAALDLAAALT